MGHRSLHGVIQKQILQRFALKDDTRGTTMKLSASLLIVATALSAQDTRPRSTLPLPPSRTPAVADAAMKGDLATVRSLIKRGADVNIAQADGMTALHWAAREGDAEMAAALIGARASVKATTRVGAYTPVHVAIRMPRIHHGGG